MSIIRNGFYCCRFLDFNDMNEGVFSVSPSNQDVDLSGKLEYRICSFSSKEALNSQLMWGHYAGAGMGVAIEIEANPDSLFKEVHYDKQDRHNSIIEILTSKTAEWRYENEWRYITDEKIDFIKEKITKINFGRPYKRLVNYAEIKAKHSTLKKYRQLSVALKSECSARKISWKNFIFPVK